VDGYLLTSPADVHSPFTPLWLTSSAFLYVTTISPMDKIVQL